MLKQKNLQFKGFTLLELLVAIALMAILATITLAGFSQGNKNRKVVLGADLLVGSIRTAQTNSQSPKPLPQSTCSLGKVPVEYHLKLDTSVPTYTLEAHDKCDNAIVLETYKLPPNVQLKSSGGLALDGSTSGSLDIRFTPPFGTMTASLNGGTFIPFSQAAIFLESTDSQVVKNVILDGISGKVETDAFVTSEIPGGNSTVPAAPTGLVATVQAGQINLSWSAPTDNGGDPVTSYNIYRGSSPGMEAFLTSVSSSSTVYSDNVVGTYYYQVSAVNGQGEGARSSEASASVPMDWTYTTPQIDDSASEENTVVYNNRIYVIGGYSWYYNTYNSAPINPDGSIGNWTPITPPIPIHGNTTIAANGYMYVIGGRNNSPVSTLKTVYYAPINSDGSLGAWNTTSQLPAAVWIHDSIYLNGYIYNIAGNTAFPQGLSTVSFAKQNADGTMGSWTYTTSVPDKFKGHAHSLVTWGNKIYMLGGIDFSNLNEVYYSTQNADGTLGPWISTTSAPLETSLGTFVNAGYIYVITGDEDSAGWGSYGAYYSKINANGSLGPWNPTSFLPIKLDGSAVFYNNGFVYVMGGNLESGDLNLDVLYATVNADGTIGN